MKKHIIFYALVHALGTAGYIALIASFLFYAPKLFGPTEPHTPLIPMLMLCLLVFSAAVTGSLVFARPILWYIDGKKNEAVSLLVYTLLTFLIIMTVLAVIMLRAR